MVKITPRFFVLPLIALAVIASLPRQIVQVCAAQAAPVAGIVRADLNLATGCTPPRAQLVMASTQALVR
jgi:hypothetical protein